MTFCNPYKCGTGMFVLSLSLVLEYINYLYFKHFRLNPHTSHRKICQNHRAGNSLIGFPSESLVFCPKKGGSRSLISSEQPELIFGE